MGVTAPPISLVERLRTAADGDLREMARDSLVGIHPDQNELREWADLMDEAADALSAQAGIADERTELTRISAEALELVRKHAVEAMNAEAARDAALARVERLEKALAFYADEQNYRMNAPLDPNSSWFEGNSRARSALSEAPSQGDQ